MLTMGQCTRRMPVIALMWSLAAAGVQAQTAPEWTLSSPDVSVMSSALDGKNQVLVAGTNRGPAMVLTKVASALPLWQQTYAGVAASRSTSVVVDGLNNVIQTGTIIGPDGATAGALVLKYSADGVLLWADQVPSTFGMSWRAATDLAGNVYVLQRVPKAGSATADDMVLAKLSPGGVREWSRSLGVVQFGVQPMAVTPKGLVVVAGLATSTGPTQVAAFDSAGNTVWRASVPLASDAAVAAGPGGEVVVAGGNANGFQATKYDAAFNPVWVQTVAPVGLARRVVVDAAGNIVLSGPTQTASGGFGATVMLHDWQTVKLSPLGTPLWTAAWGDPATDDVPNAVTTAADGSVLVTGQGSMTLTSAGVTYRVPSTVTLKYDASGALQWSTNLLPASQGVGVDVGSDGAAYVVGGGQVDLNGAAQTVWRYAPPAAPNQPPVAVASVSASSGTAPLTVAFSSAASSDPEGQLASTTWNFGDGTGSTEANPVHTYAAAGTYSVTLTVTDAQGASATSAAIAIKATAAAAQAPAPARPTALSVPASVAKGSFASATLTLSSSAGATVQLRSSDTRYLLVPSSVKVAAGATTASFRMYGRRATGTKPVSVSASANGATVSAAVSVTP